MTITLAGWRGEVGGRGRKEVVIREWASHGLWERKDDLLHLLGSWVTDKLRTNVRKAGDSVNQAP